MALNETLNILLGILTLIAGGGWFVNWKATRRRSDAEATQQEAVGWKAMQEVYEKHFEDMQLITDSVREDRDRLKEDNVVGLDEERKAAMVSNLLVVLCGSKDAQPIVNSGSLY